jgi:hypothetical protein
MSKSTLIPAERIERRILFLRGQKVMLDFELAELYGVEARTLNQAVKRNSERFPDDFMFQLSAEETQLVMRSQIVTVSPVNSSQTVMSSGASHSKSTGVPPSNWSQFVTTSKKYRGLAYRPYAFTEQGVSMLSSVLRSPRAVQVNIAIMRTFVQLRQMLASNADLARKLAALEDKYDEQFKVVFDAIRALMEPGLPDGAAGREIGFHVGPPSKGARSRLGSRKRIT